MNFGQVNITLTTWEERRSFQRLHSHTESKYVRTSLQPCSTPSDCFRRLEALLAQHKDSTKTVGKLKGLYCILLHLTVPSAFTSVEENIYQDPPSEVNGFLSFEEAFDIYCSQTSINVDKDNFRDTLLDSQFGLCVDIVTLPGTNRRYVCLHSNRLFMAKFIDEIAKQLMTTGEDDKREKIISFSEVQIGNILHCMDNEWDKMCGQMLYASGKKRNQVESVGLNLNILNSKYDKFLEICQEISHTEEEACDLVNTHLAEKQRTLEQEISTLEERIKRKTEDWSENRIQELHEKKETHGARLKCVQSLRQREDAYTRQKFNQCVKRKATNIAEAKRIKRRKIGAGAITKLDSEDEDFIARAIEEKATYHGRRHETVMYTNRRVKTQDLLNIANFSLRKRGKRPIHSAITVWNRSRPRRKNTIQARRHIGKGLFCTKKPPKAEDNETINVHHQRAHVKNVQHVLFENTDGRYALLHSMDDKATVKPGTSEGFEKTRNVKILTLSGDGAKQLPKYDWPEQKMYQTPAAHRVMEKERVIIDGKPKLITTQDRHFVVVRPKSYVDSSGSSWASETVRLRQDFPDTFLVEQPNQHVHVDGTTTHRSHKLSKDVKSACAILHDATFQYDDMTMLDDYSKVTEESDCPYRLYEVKRLEHLVRQLDKSDILLDEELHFPEDCGGILKDLLEASDAIRNEAVSLIEMLDGDLPPHIDQYDNVRRGCRSMLDLIQDFNFPKVKPRIADLTDAGPGVGVNNLEVKFRDAELVRMYGTDYKIRVHRANGDSGQNEAERTNSASGDAIVDGGTLKWETYNRFEGLSSDEVTKLTIAEFDELEERRAEKNAWCLTKQLVQRLDDAPVLSEYIHALLAEASDKQFFFNQAYIRAYAEKSKAMKDEVPGSAYMKKIFAFIDDHYDFGELYMEFLKDTCATREGILCSFCEGCGWIGPRMQRIPRPIPDHDQLPDYHYKDVIMSPSLQERLPDDYQPRACLKKAFVDGSARLDDQESIQTFADKYIVSCKLVTEYLEHLVNLKRLKEMRARDREIQQDKRKEKCVEHYDWDAMVTDGSLGKLRVLELDKYLVENNLSVCGKKADKIRRIIAHVSQNTDKALLGGSVTSVPDSDDDIDSEDDTSVREILQDTSGSEDGDSAPENNSLSSEEEIVSSTIERSSRSGRLRRPTAKFLSGDFYMM